MSQHTDANATQQAIQHDETLANEDVSSRTAAHAARNARSREWLLSRLTGGEANRNAALEDWSYYEAQFIADLIETHPELLVGPWAVLLALVENEHTLWVRPSGDAPTHGGRAASMAQFIEVDALHARLQNLKWRAWSAL